MELPKFVLADNTDFPDDVYVIHLDYPRFILNVQNDEVEFLEEVDETEEIELTEEMEKLVVKALEFYDREIERFEE
ncbi:hypothetical protein [Flavobacterium croceum]|uniref:Uncharacterized protein n=1 Tax=Flavobacterium croceum DSM 17960 TaxID=1121886 RepID=A0A2S4NAM9_9FLAO|nr:hypothetical protein [Flavobacterium croceum]POS02735.1 hypothetical protein Q361_10246 [Flavobacterium croceum DSM 17960]